MSYLRVICAAFLLVVISSLANAHDGKKVKIVTFNYPPLFHTSESGEFSGTVGETVKYMCEHAKLDCDVEVLPFKRAYQKMDNNLADAILTIKVDKFRDCCTPSTWETPWTAGLFSYDDLQTIPKFKEDMVGKSLIVVSGMRSPYEFIPDLDNWAKEKKISLFRANDAFSATKMFLSKRADYLWGSDDFNWYFDKLDPDDDRNFLPLVVRPIVLWIRKDRPHLQKTFNKAYEDLLKKGTYDRRLLINPGLMDDRYLDAPFKVDQS